MVPAPSDSATPTITQKGAYSVVAVRSAPTRFKNVENGPPPHLPMALPPSTQMCRVTWSIWAMARSSSNRHWRLSATMPVTSSRNDASSTWRTSSMP
ncbi:hypothetical protein G6F22_021564 [Rhizopus arrhizus]|nr:hypothetical protein G6F22_021564 [Rhizopus arrhizus]